MGGEAEGKEAEAFQHDIQRSGLAGRVHHVPECDNPVRIFSTCDAFALVSREEPFGIVNLEAACFECPVLCFADAGGAPEFVEEDAGFVVPYLDVEAMAEKLLVLSQDEALLVQMGKRAAEKVRERHDVNVVAPGILESMQRVVSHPE